MFFVIPVLFIGWLFDSWQTLHWLYKALSIVAFLGIEVLTGCGAVAAFKYYVSRATQILKGA